MPELGSEARQNIALAGVCVRQTQLLTWWYQEVKRKKRLKTSYIDNLLPPTSRLLLTAPSATNSTDSFIDDLTFGIKFPFNALPTEPVEEISSHVHTVATATTASANAIHVTAENEILVGVGCLSLNSLPW